MTETHMADEDEAEEQILQEKPQIVKWLGSIWLHPQATLQKILGYEKGVWLVPLLILSGLQILKNLIEGPIRTEAVLAELQAKAAKQALDSLAMGGAGMTVEAPQAVTGGFTAGPIYNILLPALLGVVGIWVVWILFGSLLHLSLTLAGNRSSASTSLNLMAWASLPLAVRLLVQIGAIFFSHQLIGSPGLSGFIDPQAGSAAGFFSSFISHIDIYLVWQFILLVMGAMTMGNISRFKASLTVLICMAIMLALQAVPGVAMQSLSGITAGSFSLF